MKKITKSYSFQLNEENVRKTAKSSCPVLDAKTKNNHKKLHNGHATEGKEQ